MDKFYLYLLNNFICLTIFYGSGETLRILIADDDAFMQEMLAQLMNDWGYSYEIVSDGKAALEKITKSDDPPDLVILDWLMPKLDGVDVCRIIRKLPDNPFCYVILLSGKGRLSFQAVSS